MSISSLYKFVTKVYIFEAPAFKKQTQHYNFENFVCMRGLIQWKIENGIFLPVIADVVVGKSYLSQGEIGLFVFIPTKTYCHCWGKNPNLLYLPYYIYPHSTHYLIPCKSPSTFSYLKFLAVDIKTAFASCKI